MRTLTGSLVVFLAIVAGAGSALAQDVGEPAPGVSDLTEVSSEPSYGLDAGLGFARMGEDYFIDLLLGFTFALGKFEAAIGVPLRLRVIDNDPQNDGIIRGEDWDEVSDWFRILRYVQYGSRRDTYFVRGGELVNVTLGHGTIVDGFANTLDVNHFQWGLTGAVNLAPGGIEVLVDNLASPEIWAFRPYVRPWAFVDPESFWNNLAIGMTLAGDIAAPRRLAFDSEGRYVFDDQENFVVEESQATWVVGTDVELQLVTTEMVSVMPYVDVNFHLGQGSGFHLGNLALFTFTDWFQLNTRFEFRALGEGYEPTWFDRLYQIERFMFRPLVSTGQRLPKLEVAEEAPPPSRVGWYGELTFAFIERLLLTVGYQDYSGDDNSAVFARLSLPEIGPVRAGAYFVNQNFDGLSELFDLDNALLAVELRVNVSGPFYAIGQYSRRWSTGEDGAYEPVEDWSFGMGVSLGF